MQARATFRNRVAVLRDACAGLVAMHAENYLHRDVKVNSLNEQHLLLFALYFPTVTALFLTFFVSYIHFFLHYSSVAQRYALR